MSDETNKVGICFDHYKVNRYEAKLSKNDFEFETTKGTLLTVIQVNCPKSRLNQLSKLIRQIEHNKTVTPMRKYRIKKVGKLNHWPQVMTDAGWKKIARHPNGFGLYPEHDKCYPKSKGDCKQIIADYECWIIYDKEPEYIDYHPQQPNN